MLLPIMKVAERGKKMKLIKFRGSKVIPLKNRQIVVFFLFFNVNVNYLS